MLRRNCVETEHLDSAAKGLILIYCFFMLALLYNFTSVYTNIASCRLEESKSSFPLQEGIFVYSRVFVQ